MPLLPVLIHFTPASGLGPLRTHIAQPEPDAAFVRAVGGELPANDYQQARPMKGERLYPMHTISTITLED